MQRKLVFKPLMLTIQKLCCFTTKIYLKGLGNCESANGWVVISPSKQKKNSQIIVGFTSLHLKTV